MWIAILLLTSLGAVVFVIWPVASKRLPWVTGEDPLVIRQLKREQGRLLRLIKDIESEREAGTIDDDDYQKIRVRFMQDLVIVNRSLVEAESDQVELDPTSSRESSLAVPKSEPTL